MALSTSIGQTKAINPWLIAITVTLATFMELLDTAIANVSLPRRFIRLRLRLIAYPYAFRSSRG